jgi:hypothetical protein
VTLWPFDPWLAIPIAAVGILAITWVVSLLIRIVRRNLDDQNIHRANFWDIIRDGDYYPSLARFQFLIWTFIISFSFLSIYLVRILGGELGFPQQIPDGVLQLMGISVVTPIIGNGLSSFKYDTTISNKRRDDIPPFTSMLLENDKPVLFRYQMFLWTFVGIGIYLFIFFSSVSTVVSDAPKAEELKCDQLKQGEAEQKGCTNLKQLSDLNLPDIDPSLVILMGLSQGAYLGGKLVARTPARINRLVVGTSDKSLIIMGENFGSGGVILIGKDKVATTPNPEVKWSDNRIDLPLPGASKMIQDAEIEIITNESISVKSQIDKETAELTAKAG